VLSRSSDKSQHLYLAFDSDPQSPMEELYHGSLAIPVNGQGLSSCCGQSQLPVSFSSAQERIMKTLDGCTAELAKLTAGEAV
jgi:hypothetical protein